jgi:hypothetical protein
MVTKASLAVLARDLAQPEIQKSINTAKTKVTFMLPNNLVSSLERCVMKMKDSNSKKRGKINKSLLVELAIKAALTDFNKRGKESQIYVNTDSRISVNTD